MIAVGDVVGGMRLDAVAGRGGMGVVYRAHELALDRDIAVKIVDPELAQDHEFRERFRREARLAASLDHPHVVPVLHAGEADGHLYLAMRLIDGVDLAALINEYGRLEPRDAVEIVDQIAGALDAAHARGLIHRDVKPANVLVNGPSGKRFAYLTDFGISKDGRDSGLTRSGHVVGSLNWISPEQLEGKAVDGRADVYSLGCVLHQALTGQVPFPRDTTASRIYAHLNTPPPTVGSIVPLLSGPLDGVLVKALAKNRDERFRSAGQLAQAARAATMLPPQAPFGAGATPRTPVAPTRLPGPGAPGPSGSWPPGGGAPPRGPTPIPAPRAPTPPSTASPRMPFVPATQVGLPTHWGAGQANRPPTPPPQHRPPPQQPSPAPPPSDRRGLLVGAVVVAVVAVLVLVLLFVVPVIAGNGGGGSGGGSTTAAAASLRPAGTITGDPIKVGAGPTDIEPGGGWVWVADAAAGAVSRIDPKTGAVTQYTVGGEPDEIAPGPGKLYVWNFRDAFTAVDMATGQVLASVNVGNDVGGTNTDGTTLWYTVPTKNAVGRVDMATGKPIGQLIPVGQRPSSIAIAGGKVYVVNEVDRTLTTLDAASGQSFGAPRSLPDGIRVVVAGDGKLFVIGSAGRAQLTDAPLTSAQLVNDPPADWFAVGGGSVWLVDKKNNQIQRVAPDMKTVVASPVAGIGADGSDLQLIDGVLWFSNKATDTVYRIAPAAL